MGNPDKILNSDKFKVGDVICFVDGNPEIDYKITLKITSMDEENDNIIFKCLSVKQPTDKQYERVGWTIGNDLDLNYNIFNDNSDCLTIFDDDYILGKKLECLNEI